MKTKDIIFAVLMAILLVGVSVTGIVALSAQGEIAELKDEIKGLESTDSEIIAKQIEHEEKIEIMVDLWETQVEYNELNLEMWDIQMELNEFI